MIRESVVSSNLESVGYDQTHCILEIEFQSGGVYQYFNVPIQEFTALLGASSKGQYFHVYIKGRYRYSRIS